MRSAPVTLEELVAPLSEEDFLSLLRLRELTLLRSTNPNRHKALLNWDMLIGMIDRGEHPKSLVEFRLARESVMVPPDQWLVRVGNANKVDPGKIKTFLDDGFSLIITPIDGHVPALAALRDNIRARVSEQIKVGVIVTAGKGGAFKLHYDPEDLIILQVEGSKRWRIYGPPVANPVVGMTSPEPPPETSPIFDEVLEPGDILFVPGGNWHHCENGPRRSLHLGIFFTPPTAWHAVRKLTSQLIAEENFVKPITRLADAGERAALEADVKKRAIELISHFEFKDFLADWAK
ncbi:MAG TPA: cupin domain-containing protein [Rhizomicrobium sp.]|nr:cupin domain-containing protein [Rhizomicrobium sp.]